MKSQHPTDEFVRRKLAEQPPEFNEAHWEQALAMLEEGAKPTAFAWLRRWWLLLPVVLLGIASLGWLMYTPDNEHSGNQNVAASHVESSAKPHKTESPSITEKQIPSKTNSPFSDEQVTINPERPLTSKNKQSSQQSVSIKANDGPSGDFANEAIQTDQSDTQLTDVEGSQKTGLTISVNQLKTGPERSPQTDTKGRVLAADGIIPIGSETRSPSGVEETGDELLDQITAGAMLLSGEDSPLILSELSVLDVDLLVPVSPKPEIRVLPLSDNRFSRHRLGVMTSLGMAGSIGDPKVNGTTPGLGLVYNYRLGRRLHFEAGASYTVRLGLGGSMNFESVRYGFGYEREETTLDFRQRHMLEFPVGIAWSPAPRHRLHVGMSIARQLNVHGEVTTVITDNYGKFITTTTRQSGYRQAYRQMDYSIQLGYGYDLSRRFNLQLLGQYGLTDLTPDDFWNEVRMDRNTQLRLQLNYFLIR